jgi:hypothetical protein
VALLIAFTREYADLSKSEVRGMSALDVVADGFGDLMANRAGQMGALSGCAVSILASCTFRDDYSAEPDFHAASTLRAKMRQLIGVGWTGARPCKQA